MKCIPHLFHLLPLHSISILFLYYNTTTTIIMHKLTNMFEIHNIFQIYIKNILEIYHIFSNNISIAALV